ncbi:MAG: carbohydrate ABC transporter permease [Spirochaetales bacterium]|nr:carbohydrate ABC transporter permease [Spirochaetales bacterium]
MKHIVRWVVLVAAVALFNLPLAATVSTAFKTPAQISSSPPVWIFRPTLENFVALMNNRTLSFGRYLFNSTALALMGTVFAVALTLPAAYTVVRRGMGRRFLVPFVTNLRTIPLIIFAIPFYFMFQRTGLLDTRLGLGLIACLINLPLAMVVFVGFFQDIPIEMEEAAYVDGATTGQMLRYIVLPLSTTVVASVALLSFIYAWNEFLFGLILTTRAALPVTVGSTFFITSFGVRWGETAAAITLSVVPPIAVGLLSFRFLARSLLAGAVKG